MFFDYFNLAKPYFKSRQEMFDLLEQPFDYIAENHKSLYMMMIEVLEATAKIASEAIENKEKALQEYEKMRLVAKWLNEAEMHLDPRFRSMSCADYLGSYFHLHPLGFFADYRCCYIGTRFDKFEYKIEQMEQEEENLRNGVKSHSLNDDFKILEYQAYVETALADLKAKMGL